MAQEPNLSAADKRPMSHGKEPASHIVSERPTSAQIQNPDDIASRLEISGAADSNNKDSCVSVDVGEVSDQLGVNKTDLKTSTNVGAAKTAAKVGAVKDSCVESRTKIVIYQKDGIQTRPPMVVPATPPRKKIPPLRIEDVFGPLVKRSDKTVITKKRGAVSKADVALKFMEKKTQKEDAAAKEKKEIVTESQSGVEKCV